MRFLTWLMVVLIGPPLAACDGGEPPPTAAAEETVNAADHDMNAVAAPATSEAAAAYDAATARMHDGMGRASDDPDETFMRMMIPHHQGAIDMAEIVLEHGGDPETRAMAEAVIEAQRREIGEMEDWLARRETGAGGR